MTANISVKQQVLNQATQLQQRFAQAKENVEKLSPSEQIIAAAQFQDDSLLLTQLQQKVQATYLSQANAIPGINEEDLLTIAEKLTAAAEILESFDNNNMIAMAYVEIASEVETLSQSLSPNDTEIRSLQGRIRDLTSANSYIINKGNREALEVANQSLIALMNQPPVVQNSSNPQSSQSVLSEDQKTMKAQDEDHQASLFQDQYKEIEKKFTKDPVQDFDGVLAHYIDVKKYALSKTSFVSETAGLAVLEHLDKLEEVMDQYIQAQAIKEGEQVQQVQGQAATSQALLDLKTAIEELLSALSSNVSNVLPYLNKIKEAHSKIGIDERTKYFDALSEHLLTLKKIPKQLPNGLRGQPLSTLPGNWQQKKEALEKILPASNGPTTSAVTVVKKADEMKKAKSEAINMQPPARKPASTLPNQPTPSQTIPPIPTELPMGLYLPDDFDFSTLNFEDIAPNSIHQQQEAPIIDVPPNVAVLHELQALLALLGPNANGAELQEACAALQILDSKGFKCAFKMSDSSLRPVSDRPFFHIYFIHKNEAPEKLQDDGQYGNKAFAGVYPATNQERLRTVQRTIVEFALENLEDAINFDDGAIVIQLLDILEGVKLDAKDRADEQENVAHNLFGAFYRLHAAARSSNPSLIDPHHSQFCGDFGRGAFRTAMNGIDPAIKIAAINHVRDRLKAVWKV
jgi:hypothetical protein